MRRPSGPAEAARVSSPAQASARAERQAIRAAQTMAAVILFRWRKRKPGGGKGLGLRFGCQPALVRKYLICPPYYMFVPLKKLVQQIEGRIVDVDLAPLACHRRGLPGLIAERDRLLPGPAFPAASPVGCRVIAADVPRRT